MRIQRCGGAFMLLALGLVACGGSKSSASPTPSDTAVFSTTNPPLPTTVAVATVPSAAAATSTSAPPATAAPTTARPFIPIKDQVAEAVHAYLADFARCSAVPTECKVSAFTASEGTLRANLVSGTQKMVENRYVAREDPADPTYLNVTKVEMAGDDRSATVHVCFWDPVFVYQVGGAPDGTDILINSVKSTVYRTYGVFLEVNGWRVGTTTKLSEVKGVNECGPRK